jgi:hypothetical protein
MSKESHDLRNLAASELRLSRKGLRRPDDGEHTKRAASLKALAENEEWLSGEKQRSRKQTKNSR